MNASSLPGTQSRMKRSDLSPLRISLALLSGIFAFQHSLFAESTCPYPALRLGSAERGSPLVKAVSLVNRKTGRSLKGLRRLQQSQTIPASRVLKKKLFLRFHVRRSRTRSLIVQVDGVSKRAKRSKKLQRIKRSKRPPFVLPWNLENGLHTLQVIPFQGRRARGATGPRFEICLSVEGPDSNTSRNDTGTKIDFIRAQGSALINSPALAIEDISSPSSTDPELLIPHYDERGWAIHHASVYKNGKAQFPFGIYYTAHYSSQRSKRLRDLRTIAGLGLNIVHTPISLRDGEFLDLAAQLGVDVVVEFNDRDTDVINKFGGHPAFAWTAAFDDVDEYRSDGTLLNPPSLVARESTRLKTLAPRALTYSSGGWPDRISRYLGKSDVLAQQGYIVPFEALYALSNGYYRNLSDAAKASNQFFLANLQTFGWYGKYRLPTASELRNMTYQSLALGAAGVIYYAFVEPDNDLSTNTELLTELGRLSNEVKSLQNILLFGEREEFDTGDKASFAARWRTNKAYYLVVMNAHSSETKSFSLSLGDSSLNTLQNLFRDRPRGLTILNGTVSGIVLPEEVHVYRIPLE